MRILKWLTYGLFYIAILGILGFGVYRIATREEATCFDGIKNQDETAIDCGGSCIACEVSEAKLETGEVIILPVGDDRITVFTEVKNPAEHGAFFEYQIDIISSSGGVPESVEGASFVAPNSRRYIVLPGVSISPADAGSAKISLKEVKWDTEGKADIILLDLFGVQTVIKGDEAIVVGSIVNRSGEIVREAKLTAVLFGKDKEVLTASSVTLRNIGILGEIPFKIFLPVPDKPVSKEDLARMRIFVEVVPK